MTAAGASSKKRTVIGPQPMAPADYLREVADHARLLRELARKDIIVRYRQAALGVLWAILRPVLTALLLTFVFSYALRLTSESGNPYALVALCGVVAWQFYTQATIEIMNAILLYAPLSSKRHVPQLVFLLAEIGLELFDLCIAICCVFLAGAVYYGILPSRAVLLLPLYVLLVLPVIFGPASILACWNVRYRDVRYVVPLLLQLGFFATPVAYELRSVAVEWQWVFLFNPLTAIVEGFRWCLLPVYPAPPLASYPSTVLFGVGLSVAGLQYLIRSEKELLDVL